MGLHPVQQSQLILRQLGQDLRLLIALAQLFLHLRYHIGNAGVPGVGVERSVQIQLAVLLNLNAQPVQGRDRRVAGQKVLGTGAEGNDLQIRQCQQRRCHRHKVPDHGGTVRCRTHRVLGNIRLHATQVQIIGRIKHTTVGVAAAVQQAVAALFRRCAKHRRAVKLLGQSGLCRLRTEVAQEDHQGVDPGSL